MAAKFFTGLPLDGPDPECVLGHGEALLAARGGEPPPRSSVDHSRRGRPPERACDEDPLASFCARRHGRWRALSDWFESVAEAQRRAQAAAAAVGLRARCSPAPSTGSRSTTTSTRSASSASCRAIATGLRAARELATTVLGQRVSLPVIISPTGVQAVHPGGEVAVARAAAAAGTALGLSSFASKPVEEVVAANPQTFFQIYWFGTPRADVAAARPRASGRGAKGLIVTLDWTFSHRRDWGSPAIPERLDLRSDGRARARRCSLRPRWLLDFLRDGGLPDLVVPNLAAPASRRRRSSAPTASG